MKVFRGIGPSIEKAVDAYIGSTATQLIDAIQILALTGVTLYIVITGYAIMTGAIESPVKTLIKQCVTY